LFLELEIQIPIWSHEMNVTRRKMLLGAAGFCAASAISGISAGCKKPAPKTGSVSPQNRAQATVTPPPCPGAIPFSIILHGLFFVEVLDANAPNEQRIRVISPKCAGMTFAHEHQAGSWKNKNFSNIVPGSSAPGWQTPRTTRPDITGLPTFAGWAGRVSEDKIHHSLYLPWPDAIIALRKVDPLTVTHSGLGNPTKFPLTLALKYQCGAPKDLTPIDQTDWSKDNNFHIFCEPKCKIPCGNLSTHADEIIQCIARSFGSQPPNFQLKPKNWDCNPQAMDKPPAASHIDQIEESSLSEISPCLFANPQLSPQEQIESVHLPMCASFILTTS
jgi:hypothetical protein